MKCNLERYLEEQELACRRLARSANSGTLAEQEWTSTAQVLLQRRQEHVIVCPKCAKES